MAGVKDISVGKYSILILLGVLLLKGTVLAQCVTPQVNVYASSQQSSASGLFSSVANAGDAVNGDLTDFSTLNTGVLGSAIQYLQFSSTVTSGTPVIVKLSLPVGLLSVLGGVKIQPYINSSHDAVGPALTSASLLALLNGAGDTEITITPSGNYDGVAISISGISIAQSLKIYEAFYTQNTTVNTGCNTAIDVLSGVRANTVLGSLLTSTGSVNNPRNAIDASASSFATLDIGIKAFSEAFHTTIFHTLSQTGDTIKMVVQNSGGGLLDLGVSSGFQIQLFNGTTAVGSPIAGSSTNLKLTLFPDGSDKYELDVSPPSTYGPYDRVEVQVGGTLTLGLTKGLKIYDVTRVIATPATSIDGTVATTKSICLGNSTTLSINNTQSCTTYNWYDAAAGGTLLHTGDTYTPNATLLSTPGDHHFYVEANRDGCSEVNVRSPSTITVNPLPGISHAAIPNVCSGATTAAVSYTAGANTPTTYNIVWALPAITAGFVNVTDAVLPASTTISVAVPSTAPAGAYTGNLYVKNANGCISAADPFSINVDAKPTQPLINLTPQ